jgi:NAD+ diphosphatase
VSDFVPLLLPPDSPAISGSLWVHVGEGGVLVSETPGPGVEHQFFLGMLGTVACWAADAGSDPAAAGAEEGDGFVDLRQLWGRVPEQHWTIAGRAVQIVEWARTHRYCGRCGSPTETAPGERAMRCPDCGLLSFPRLAPAVIVLITRGDEALLARGRLFPMPMYSCIAGFVEPGETLEQAVHREVREEVGVELADVRYAASQPWPFPHSLMIGFTATWAGGEIVIDEGEILDARWFRRDDVPMIPPAISIARRLIDSWLLA